MENYKQKKELYSQVFQFFVSKAEFTGLLCGDPEGNFPASVPPSPADSA